MVTIRTTCMGSFRCGMQFHLPFESMGDLVEGKLKSFGLGFPWTDAEAKYFTGLGSTKGTLGKRKLPFCLALDVGDDTLAGVMESHEIDTSARNPLLISLFAQSSLGLEGHENMYLYHSGQDSPTG